MCAAASDDNSDSDTWDAATIPVPAAFLDSDEDGDSDFKGF